MQTTHRITVAAIFLLLAGCFTAVGAQPVVVTLDWEPACEGSCITVTTDSGRPAMIEAWAQHSAESREWIFIYKNGILASVVYRHFKHTRSLVEQDGSFITNRTLDRIVVADLKDGKPTNLDEDMRKDFDDIMQKATATNLKKP